MTPHELLESVRGWLWQLAFRAARRHGLDADDLFQQAATRLLQSAHTYDPVLGRPSTWASRVMMTATQCLLRLRDKHALAAGYPLDTLPLHAEDEAPDLAPLSAALGSLPERHRQVLALRFGYAGPPHSLAEIGRTFGFSRERARQVEQAALKELKTAYLASAFGAA